MKKFVNLCLIALICVTSFIFTGCDKGFSVYVFSSEGGYVTINESNDKILLKEVLECDEKVEIKFTAHADDGYQFLHWIVDTKVYSEQAQIVLTVSQETVVKAIFENAGSYVITYQDESGNFLGSETIMRNEEISNVPAIEEREGYRGAFYIGNTEIYNGKVFTYSSNKTCTLKYTKRKYTISTPSSAEYDFVLCEGYSSWTVEYGDDIKFTVTPINSDNVLTVYLDDGLISANSKGVYTISNVKKSMTITVLINGEEENENETCSIEFDVNYDNNINVSMVSSYSSTSNGKYYVAIGSDVRFKVTLTTTHAESTLKVTVNGVVLSSVNDVYTLLDVTENTVINCVEEVKFSYSINYGYVGGVEFEMAMSDSDYLPYYEGEMTLKYTQVDGMGYTLYSTLESQYSVEGDDATTLSWKEFINYVNSIELNTASNYRVKGIQLYNSTNDYSILDFCTVTYTESGTAIPEFASYCCTLNNVSNNTITIIWETY